MHEILWTSIQVDELHRRLGLGLILLPAAAALVQELVEEPESTEDGDLKVWVNGHDQHRLNELWTDLFIPVLVQVRVLAVKGQPLENRVLKLGIRHEQDDTRVDERRVED